MVKYLTGVYDVKMSDGARYMIRLTSAEARAVFDFIRQGKFGFSSCEFKY